jgi:hypothetical protein
MQTKAVVLVEQSSTKELVQLPSWTTAAWRLVEKHCLLQQLGTFTATLLCFSIFARSMRIQYDSF